MCGKPWDRNTHRSGDFIIQPDYRAFIVCPSCGDAARASNEKNFPELKTITIFDGEKANAL